MEDREQLQVERVPGQVQLLHTHGGGGGGGGGGGEGGGGEGGGGGWGGWGVRGGSGGAKPILESSLFLRE